MRVRASPINCGPLTTFSLYDDAGDKRFHSVIVVTDRTVLDNQLQDTIYQFGTSTVWLGVSTATRAALTGEAGKGFGRLDADYHRHDSDLPFVLKAIENSVSLKERTARSSPTKRIPARQRHRASVKKY